jgi:molybdate transport system regulatory protein
MIFNSELACLDGAIHEDNEMTYGARNKIKGKVTSIKSDSIMSLVKFETASGEMASVLTTESVEDMKLSVGDQVELIIKAIHVLPVKH